jgi:hypothetical protein
LSTDPVELIVRGYRRIGIPFFNDRSYSPEAHVQRSAALPLPYYVEKIVINAAYTSLGSLSVSRFYIADDPNLDYNSVSSETDLVAEIGGVKDLNTAIYYSHFEVELQRKVTDKRFIYYRTNEGTRNYGIMATVYVILTPVVETK